MKLNIYSKYKVKFKQKYSYNTPSYYFFNDWHNETTRWTKNIDGSHLINMIKQDLNDDDVQEFNIEDNKVYISIFNPFSGESRDIWYEIVEKWKDD